MTSRLALLLLPVLLAPPGLARADEPAEAAVEVETQAESEPQMAHEDDEYDELYFDEDLEEEDDHDPLEGFNRAMFGFNDWLDVHAIKPVADAFDYVIPDFMQRALRRAFDNLSFPVVFVNNLLQGKPTRAGKDFARFAVNSTVGIAGFMDPASTIGLKRSYEDFGQTLGFWGVPPGPYLVLPIIGPSDLRDTGGLVVDSGTRALGFFIPYWASLGMGVLERVNWRSLNREAIDSERQAALDWYVAVRSAYTQYRENLVRDEGRATDEDEDEVGGYYPVFQDDEGS